MICPYFCAYNLTNPMPCFLHITTVYIQIVIKVFSFCLSNIFLIIFFKAFEFELKGDKTTILNLFTIDV